MAIRIAERFSKLFFGISAVIFDMDGTLVDSMWMWTDIDKEYLGKRDLPFPDTLQSDIEGMSFTETAEYFKRRFALPDSIDEIKAEWLDMTIEKYRHEVFFKPHALYFLKYLKEQGIRIGIATSNGREMAEACLLNLCAFDYVEELTTACEVERGKPAPDVYLRTAEKLGVKPSACLVFEDVAKGVLGARAAGMRVIGVHDDYCMDSEDVIKSLSDEYIRDFSELFEGFCHE